MKRSIVPIGDRHGRLTVLGVEGDSYRCQCDCGQTSLVRHSRWIKKVTRSCGCLTREAIASVNRSHEMCRTPTYRSWCGIIERTTKPTSKMYFEYGGRGITVCDRWLGFANFLDDMGVRPDGTSIDRINNDAGYEPGNCRWATRSEQNRNTRRTVMLTFHGRTLSMPDWSEETGVPYYALRNRISRGWPVEDALTWPLGAKRPRTSL